MAKRWTLVRKSLWRTMLARVRLPPAIARGLGPGCGRSCVGRFLGGRSIVRLVCRVCTFDRGWAGHVGKFDSLKGWGRLDSSYVAGRESRQAIGSSRSWS